MKRFNTMVEKDDFVPAADILAEAEADRPEFGHSPQGFLSRSCGFLPVNLPLEAMPATHQAWDEAAAILPELLATQRVGEALDDLPLLSGRPEDLDEVYLWRASLVLGFLAHAYVHSGGVASPPPNISKPWSEVNHRLGRPPTRTGHGGIH